MRSLAKTSVISLSAFALVSLIPSLAMAQTPTLTYDNSTGMATGNLDFSITGYSKTDFLSDIYIPLFDSNVGNLTSVTLTIDTGFYSTETFTNTSTSSAAQVNEIGVEVDLNVYQASGALSNQLGNSYDNSNFTTATIVDENTPGDSGYYTLAANNAEGTNPDSTASATFGSAGAPITDAGNGDTYSVDSSSDPTDTSSFSAAGGGVTTASGQTTSYTNFSYTGGNASADQTTMGELSGTVTYTYEPTPATPADVSMGVGLAMSAMVFVRRKSRTTAKDS